MLPILGCKADHGAPDLRVSAVLSPGPKPWRRPRSQVENHLKRSDGDFDVLPYHAAISEDVRPRNLQVGPKPSLTTWPKT